MPDGRTALTGAERKRRHDRRLRSARLTFRSVLLTLAIGHTFFRAIDGKLILRRIQARRTGTTAGLFLG